MEATRISEVFLKNKTF